MARFSCWLRFRVGPGYVCVCVFITAGPMIMLCAVGEGDSEGPGYGLCRAGC